MNELIKLVGLTKLYGALALGAIILHWLLTRRDRRVRFTLSMLLAPASFVLLMPLFDFATVDDFKKGYNWGYDPHHFFTPEGWYSSNPDDPYSRLNELISLVSVIHDNKLGVILDVVYNHVFEESTIDAGAPGCYFRRNSLGDVSFHTGAGPSLESRNPMVRKLIISSLLEV